MHTLMHIVSLSLPAGLSAGLAAAVRSPHLLRNSMKGTMHVHVRQLVMASMRACARGQPGKIVDRFAWVGVSTWLQARG